MKLIIAGSRSINPTDEQITEWLRKHMLLHRVDTVLCGMARGVDRAGLRWAKNNQRGYKLFPADWDRFGNRAGILRNKEMAAYGDEALIVWDGASPGSKHMISAMTSLKKPTWVVKP